MKFLIFGDIHGNLPALEKLFEIEEGNYDIAVCHGDVVNYGPWSNDCVDYLDSLSEVILLKGNHEEAFLKNSYPGKNEIAKAFFQFCYPRFDRQEKIKDYGSDFKAGNYVISHTVYETYLYPDSDLSRFNFKENHIIGHSHYQFERRIKGHKIVNTGSVGQNRRIINLAEYVIYDDVRDQLFLKSFRFDIDKLIQKMEDEKYPEVCLNYYKEKTTI